MTMSGTKTPILEMRDLTAYFRTHYFGIDREVRAIDGISFEARRNEIYGLAGEPSSGKTTLIKTIAGAVRAPLELVAGRAAFSFLPGQDSVHNAPPSAGTIRFRGDDETAMRFNAARLAFMAQVQPIFQNPFEAFNPLKRIGGHLFTAARRFADATDAAVIDACVDTALRHVGLSLAEIRGRFPHELSGGQLQRVSVARALIPNPSRIVADVPVSMVDASLRMSMRQTFPLAARHARHLDHLHHP